MRKTAEVLSLEYRSFGTRRKASCYAHSIKGMGYSSRIRKSRISGTLRYVVVSAYGETKPPKRGLKSIFQEWKAIRRLKKKCLRINQES